MVRFGDKPGPVVMLRADMDALPIQDEKDVEYASQKAGAMHACGHDGHVSILLGTALYFSKHKADIQGEIRFCSSLRKNFWRAVKVIADGALEGVDVIYGIHLWTPLPVGVAASKEGPLMAAADDFTLRSKERAGMVACRSRPWTVWLQALHLSCSCRRWSAVPWIRCDLRC